jgi:thiol-disulfide isomerase/thioredoxin
VRAKRDNKRILALFTGSDWCPPCRQFEVEVAHDEQFAGIFANSFVFFKNDWLRNTPQPREVLAEVSRVGHKYGISRYPTLKILNADGEVLGDVKWTEVRGGGSFKEIMIEAIDDTRKATKNGKAA